MGTSNQKESVLDVLSRMKTELKFDVNNYADSDSAAPCSNNDAAKKPAPTAATTAATAVKEPKAPAAPVPDPTPSENVDELTNYMGNLLSRYGKGASAATTDATGTAGDASSNGESHLPQRKPKSLEAAAQPTRETNIFAADANSETSGDLIPGEFCLLEQRDFVPRKRAPEEKACLDAMRELAVHSARKAIQVCDNKKRGFDAKHRLMLGFGAFATSGVAFLFAEAPFSFLGCVAMCGIAAGCMFFVNWQKTVALVKKSNAS